MTKSAFDRDWQELTAPSFAGSKCHKASMFLPSEVQKELVSTSTFRDTLKCFPICGDARGDISYSKDKHFRLLVIASAIPPSTNRNDYPEPQPMNGYDRHTKAPYLTPPQP